MSKYKYIHSLSITEAITSDNPLMYPIIWKKNPIYNITLYYYAKFQYPKPQPNPIPPPITPSLTHPPPEI